MIPRDAAHAGAMQGTTVSRAGWGWVERKLGAVRRSLRGRLLYALAGLFVLLLAVEGVQHALRMGERRRLLAAGQERAASTAAAGFQSALRQVYRAQRTLGGPAGCSGG